MPMRDSDAMVVHITSVAVLYTWELEAAAFYQVKVRRFLKQLCRTLWFTNVPLFFFRTLQVSQSSDLITTFRPTLLLMPLRLGMNNFNKIYTSQLKAFLTLPQSIGFVGGKPNASFYFVGYQGMI
jgi:hypothetical protein